MLLLKPGKAIFKSSYRSELLLTWISYSWNKKDMNRFRRQSQSDLRRKWEWRLLIASLSRYAHLLIGSCAHEVKWEMKRLYRHRYFGRASAMKPGEAITTSACRREHLMIWSPCSCNKKEMKRFLRQPPWSKCSEKWGDWIVIMIGAGLLLKPGEAII